MTGHPIDQAIERTYQEEALGFMLEARASDQVDWTITQVVEHAAQEARRELVEWIMQTNEPAV